MSRKIRKGIQRYHRKTSYQMKKKLVILYLGVLLALVGLLIRITYINATQGEKYKKQVLSQAQSKYESAVLPAKRGDIYDRNGNILATSNKVYNVILDCKAVNDAGDAYIEATVDALVDLLGLEEADIRTRLYQESTRNSQYQILKKQLSVEDKKVFDEYCNVKKDSGLPENEYNKRKRVVGVWFEEDYLRIYPYNTLACDTIGFTFSRDTADWGLEGYYNSSLMGADGRQYGYFTGSSQVEQTIIAPTNGYSIETSLDVNIQEIVEKYVNAFMESMGAKNVGVIIEDPNTGEILAMDGGDRYDLNNPRDMSGLYTSEEIKKMTDAETVEKLNRMWNNFCTTDSYEPGSVVKPLVMAAALEKGSISTSDMFECDGGQQYGTDTYIRCAVYPDSHGDEKLEDVIANSCNDGMMQIASRMGAEQFVKAQSQFNFGSRTGIDLPNEGFGIIHSTETMGATELACSAFGQGFTCTMIQEISAMCSAVNGGYYYQPHLVTKIKDASGSIVKTITPTLMKQTISANISDNIRSYMERSVQAGTSQTTKIQGFSSGGKTGTAEKQPRGNGNYLVSFIGFAPVSAPKFVIYVVVDEPMAMDQATSVYAQYIAQGIMYELLPYMNISPDEIGKDGFIGETQLWEGFKGHLTVAGGTIDEDGHLVNEAGQMIDMDGKRVNSEGYLLDRFGDYILDENGYAIMSQNLYHFAETKLPEAVSNAGVPAPLDGERNPMEGNDMESEGVTNEEAGFD